MASPHQLNYLVAGFLRTQGFNSGLNELLVLGICQEEGVAQVRVKGEIAGGLRPVVTTGCGGGISFIREDEFSDSPAADKPFSAEGVFELFRTIYAQAELFRRHGGVHSGAIGDGQALLLLAEDLGRHNTVDRLAGEALFGDVDLRGMLICAVKC